MRSSWIRRGILVGGALALTPSIAAAGSSPWGGDARADVFWTNDLFPGGDAAEPTWGARLTLDPRVTARLGKTWRLRPWGQAVIECYRDYRDRDLERWAVGLDLKRGPSRLRLYGGWTRHELYFPSSTGGAWLDRTSGGGEVRVGMGAEWMAQVRAEVEREDFVPNYDPRDDTRWTLWSSVEYGVGDVRRFRLVHVYRKTDSDSHLYSYEQNALRAEAGWRAAGWDFLAEGEAGLRNYRTGLAFASNFARQDDRMRARAGVGRVIVPHLSAQGYGEWRRTDSTRLGKDYDVATAGVALTLTK